MRLNLTIPINLPIYKYERLAGRGVSTYVEPLNNLKMKLQNLIIIAALVGFRITINAFEINPESKVENKRETMIGHELTEMNYPAFIYWNQTKKA